MPTVITARISVLGTGQGVDTRGLRADSCMGSFSIKGCLGKGKKKNPVSQSLLKAACPGPGDSQVWLGPATPPTPPLAGRTASTVLSWERLVESCPAQAAFSNGRRKHRSLSKRVSGSLESLTFCKSFSSLSRGEPYSPGEWVRILESHRIGFEPEF